MNVFAAPTFDAVRLNAVISVVRADRDQADALT